MRLEGQRALVTGGSRSIGRAIALGIAREGADVVVNYRQDRVAAERTAADIRALGRRAAVVQGDTSVRSDVDRLVAEAIAALGAIDLLVNNAGVLKRTPLLEIEEREWDWILDTKRHRRVGVHRRRPDDLGRLTGPSPSTRAARGA
jgi:3-oxoacyl-[acyl-carrier protein] reductase